MANLSAYHTEDVLNVSEFAIVVSGLRSVLQFSRTMAKSGIARHHWKNRAAEIAVLLEKLQKTAYPTLWEDQTYPQSIRKIAY